MRLSFFHILSYLLLALLPLSCAGDAGTADRGPKTENQFNETLTDVSEEVKPAEAIPHLELAESYIGTTELTGNNDGPEVEMFLAAVDLPPGNPYCAAFVSYILNETPEVMQPTVRSGLASHFVTDYSINAKEVLRGTVAIPDGTIVIWQKGNTIFGHAGFVEAQEETNQFLTIEANTSPGENGNQSDGDGVWRRSRTIEPGNYFRITSFTPVTYHS